MRWIIVILLLLGCSKTPYKNKGIDILTAYEVGSKALTKGDINSSLRYFEIAEGLIQKYDKGIEKFDLSILLNDYFSSYTPKIYEKVMVNTYKGIEYFLIGDIDSARVEFNRALVRIERAKEFFKKEINLKEKEIYKEAKRNSIKDLRVENILREYSNLIYFKGYKGFVNPFVLYMSGLFFLSVEDYDKAVDLFKECYGIIRDEAGSEVVLRDLEYAKELNSINPKKRHFVWVVLFNGKSVIKKEQIFEVPMYLFSDKIYYIGLALPVLVERKRSVNILKVNNKVAKRVALMDSVIASEFKKRLPTVVKKEILRVLIQSYIQYKLRKEIGVIGGVVGAIYLKVMNHADLRMWRSLPKEFDVIRVVNKGEVTIIADNKKIFQKKLKKDRSYIIFIVEKKIYLKDFK